MNLLSILTEKSDISTDLKIVGAGVVVVGVDGDLVGRLVGALVVVVLPVELVQALPDPLYCAFFLCVCHG